jgi:tetratricopeptide (TPR) repeat protein
LPAVEERPKLRARARAAVRAMRPERIVAALGVLAFAAVAAFAIWQPLRAVHAGNDALLYLSQGRADAARNTAQIAEKRNPLSVDPLFDLAVIEDSSGHRAAANHALERAVELQPANPETWRRLGNFRLNALGDPQGARGALRAALYLDPNSIQATSDYLLAGRAIVAQEQAKQAAAQLKAQRRKARRAAKRKAAQQAGVTP